MDYLKLLSSSSILFSSLFFFFFLEYLTLLSSRRRTTPLSCQHLWNSSWETSRRHKRRATPDASYSGQRRREYHWGFQLKVTGKKNHEPQRSSFALQRLISYWPSRRPVWTSHNGKGNLFTSSQKIIQFVHNMNIISLRQ